MLVALCIGLALYAIGKIAWAIFMQYPASKRASTIEEVKTIWR